MISLPDDAQLVTIWTIDLDVSDSRLDAAAQSLSADELERAATFRNDIARRNYILSHSALRQILAKHLQQPATGITFQTGPNGKPSLVLPNLKALHFNLSHSGTVALVAISQLAEVGVDVETIRPMKDAAAIAKRFFTPQEAKALEKIGSSEQSTAFLNLWTRKEALVKATGQGIANGLARFHVSCGGDAILHSIDGDAKQAAQWSLHSFTPAPGYIAASAIQLPNMQFQVRNFSWC